MNRWIPIALAAALFVPTAAAGQAAWDAPSFMRPGAPSGLTLALTDTDPGSGLGFMALWRAGAAPLGVGFRAGLAEAPGDDLVGLVGLDLSGSLASPFGPGGPDALWWTGAGITLADDMAASFPLGLALGWTANAESVSLAPYVGGHMVLDVLSGPGDDLDLDGAVDLGLDVTFSQGWIVRFAAALGGRESLGIGVRIPR